MLFNIQFDCILENVLRNGEQGKICENLKISIFQDGIIK